MDCISRLLGRPTLNGATPIIIGLQLNGMKETNFLTTVRPTLLFYVRVRTKKSYHIIRAALRTLMALRKIIAWSPIVPGPTGSRHDARRSFYNNNNNKNCSRS